MALKLSVNSPYGGVNSFAHIVLQEMILNFQSKVGRLELAIWIDKQAKLDGKKWIGMVTIPIGTETIIIDDEENPNDGCIVCIGFSDLKDKTLAQIYTKLKTLKLIFKAGNIDLTQSVEEPD